MNGGMIRVVRRSAWSGRIRAFKIYIDDVDHGKIRNNETKEFMVENGSHEVYIRIDFHKSQKLPVYVDNSIVTLEASLPLAIQSNNPRLRRVSVEPLLVEAELESEGEAI